MRPASLFIRRRTIRIPKALLAVCLPLLAGGCGMPPAIALLGYAADGVSYAASGKGVADHALSAAADRDCAFLRIAGGEAVCRPESADPDGAAPALAMIAVREDGPGREPGASGQAAPSRRGPAWAISASAGIVGRDRPRPGPAGDGADLIAAGAVARTAAGPALSAFLSASPQSAERTRNLAPAPTY